MQTCRCEHCGHVLAVFATIAPGLALPASTGPVMAQVEARAREHERACGRPRSARRVFRAVRGPGYAGVGSSGAGSPETGSPATGSLGGSKALELVEFDLASAPAVSSWARTEQEVQAWCSRPDAPVPPDVVAGWSQAPDVVAYLLLDGAEPIGYGELWVDDEEAEVELARLIVEPAHRGRGVGREMVARLVQKAKQHHSSVLMRVHPDNTAARHCYAAAGFTRVPAEDEAAWNQGQPVQYVWMALG